MKSATRFVALPSRGGGASGVDRAVRLIASSTLRAAIVRAGLLRAGGGGRSRCELLVGGAAQRDVPVLLPGVCRVRVGPPTVERDHAARVAAEAKLDGAVGTMVVRGLVLVPDAAHKVALDQLSMACDNSGDRIVPRGAMTAAPSPVASSAPSALCDPAAIGTLRCTVHSPLFLQEKRSYSANVNARLEDPVASHEDRERKLHAERHDHRRVHRDGDDRAARSNHRAERRVWRERAIVRALREGRCADEAGCEHDQRCQHSIAVENGDDRDVRGGGTIARRQPRLEDGLEVSDGFKTIS